MTIISRSLKILKEGGAPLFFKKAFSRLTTRPIDVILSLYYAIRIKAIAPHDNINSIVDFVFKGCRGLIKPVQLPSEISELISMVKDIRPGLILEIGTARGGTLFLFSRVARKDAVVITVDLPGSSSCGYPSYKIPLFKSFGLPHQNIILVRADSHLAETAQNIRVLMRDKPIDALFIDGDHSYAGVKRDFELYSPFVRKGGFIALHDIALHPHEIGCDVRIFWDEIKPRYRHKEIIADTSQEGFGIGVVYID